MLEFAREQYLWLFALVALFFVVFFFARRWKKARVTYGFIWERVAKRTRPPTWKRLLRLILTLLISAAMLSSAALYAAGLSPAKEQEPAPLLVFIVIDNSPSMRASVTLDSETRGRMALDRAQEIVDVLADSDRAMVAHFNHGQAVAGRWLKRAENVRGWHMDALPTDFANADLHSLTAMLIATGAPPDVPSAPAPQKLVLWLDDSPPEFEPGLPPARLIHVADNRRWGTYGGLPVLAETFGSSVGNDGVVEASFKSATPGSGVRGWVEARLRSGKPLESLMDMGSPARRESGNRFEIPFSERGLTFTCGTRVNVDPLDCLPEDDVVSTTFGNGGVSRVTYCYGGETPNPLLLDGLKLLLPGRQIKTVAATEIGETESDMVILDGVSVEARAKVLLCFGALPPSLGEVQTVREAKAGLFDALEKPEWLGFEIPNLQLLAGREAFPLKSGHKLTPLATHVEAGVLVAASRGERDVLYIGYSPTQSNFLFVPEGPTLLQRWLNAVQGRERMIVPPFCRMDQSVEIKLDSPAPLRVKLLKGWENVIGATEYDVTPSPDGRAKLGPFEQPGEYEVLQQGRALGRMAVYWVDEAEQALPYTPLEPLDLTKLAPVREHSWVDWFPEILLWIALCGLMLEWLFWLIGWTD